MSNLITRQQKIDFLKNVSAGKSSVELPKTVNGKSIVYGLFGLYMNCMSAKPINVETIEVIALPGDADDIQNLEKTLYNDSSVEAVSESELVNNNLSMKVR